MAFERRYESTYFSLNGTEYYLEIRDQNWPSGIGVKQADLGVGGCAIHYDMEGEQKYSPIIASKMDIPFLVKDGTDAVFIKNLIEDYNEGDVVVALYKGSSATYKPIWAGYLLMDLGAQQDVSYPYEVKITATDGLARLKDIGFWSNEATQLTYAHKGHERITYWIGQILNKLTPPGTTQGISQDAIIRAAVNWYNEKHDNAGTTFGPLYQTQIKMGMMEDRNTAGDDSVRNCYDVLKDLCTTFGMRCIYWKHSFYFIQLDGYNTAESGTLVNPTNINTRDYSLADPPVHTASRDYLGTSWWARYNQNIENQTTPGKGIQKLAGTTYQNYPILKRVSADFITANDQNYYRGFPESTPGPNDTASVGDIVKVVQQKMNDPQSATKILLRVPLTFQQDTSVASYNQIYDNYRIKFYCYIKATVPTSATGTGTDPQYLRYSGGSYSWTTTLPTWGQFILLQSPLLTAADTGVQILTPYNSNGGELPPFTGVTGTWEFEIILQAYMQSGGWKDPVKVYAGTTGTSANGEDYNIHGVKWANALAPNAGITFSNISTNSAGVTAQSWFDPNGNPFLGDLFLLNSSLSVGSMGTKVITETNENDTSQLFLGQMFWGDSPMDSDPSSILVWDGAAWEFTDPTGEWGIGTITPASPASLTKLLLKEYLDGQSFHVYKMNARITLSAHNKNQTDASGQRPKYVNPIGRINDVDGKSYIFLRGTFTTGDDTWDGEWFNIGRGTPTLTTTTQSIYSSNTPATDSSLPMPAIAGGNGNAGAKLGAPLGITTTSARISGTTIVTNGEFQSDTAWTKGTGVTIADNKLQFSDVADGIGATNSATLTIGKEYKVDYTVSGYSSGGAYVKLGNTAGTTREANGTYSENITPLTTDTIKILAKGTSKFNIDTISIVERITSIPILDIGETLLADNDRITLVDSNSGQVYELRLNAAQTSGQTTLTIDAYDFTEDVEAGAFISIDSKNLIQQYQNKTEGTINISQYSFTERSTDASFPIEGNSVMWMSDGTASGDDGDMLITINTGAALTTSKLDLTAIAANAFTFTVDTTASGSASDTFVLPLVDDGTIDIYVNWGDGNSDIITTYNQTEITHQYSAGGTYSVTMQGTIRGFRFADAGDKEKMRVVSKWGDLNITQTMAFKGCLDMTCTASDAPTILDITDLSSTFSNCTDLTGIGGAWDMSAVTSLESFFYQCSNFNQDISAWNVSNVTNFDELFYLNVLFNQDISGWNTSAATTMVDMLDGNPSGAFNQNISSWDIADVTDFGTNFMREQTLSTANYDALLIAWDGQSVQSGLTLDFGNSKYTDGGTAATARANLISSDSWTISDGGAAEPTFSNVYSLDFDGVDDYMDIADAASVISGATGSISFWFKGTSISGGYFFEFKVDANNYFQSYYAWDIVNSTRRAGGSNNSAASFGDGSGDDGNWHHAAYTWSESADELIAYADGVAETTRTGLGTWAGTPSIFTIGRYSHWSGGYLDGNIDEIAIFDSALTAAEVTAIYNSGEPTDLTVDAGDYTSSSDLVGYWRNGDPDGTSEYPTISDDSTNSNDGTMTNMTSGDIVEDVP
tara:strand:- start:3925 stop:8625 length:4701 start_codon:yes stop_codon:yes gene_type:complete